MTDNEIKREMTFSEELPYFKERIKEVFDNYDNPDSYADTMYLSALSASHRIVRKAEEEIKHQQEEIERLKATVDSFTDIGKMYSEIKSEAIKKFAERLVYTLCINNEENTDAFDYAYTLETINNLVKELISG